MFGSTENFWAWLVFTSIFSLAFWFGIPKRLGASLELQIVIFASVYALLYTLFNAPNAALMWVLVAVTVFALITAHMIVRNCQRAVVRQPLIGGLALAAVGLTLVLPTTASLEVEWLAVGLLTFSVLYAGIVRPRNEKPGVAEDDDDHAAAVNAISDASDEMNELVLSGLSAAVCFIFAFIHLRDKFLGYNPDLSYLTVSLYLLAVTAAVCLIRFQFDREKRVSPITRR